MQKLTDANGYKSLNSISMVRKLHPNAEAPFKEKPYDAGWELTIIGRDENRVEDVYNDVNVFTTGLSVIAPKGYHFEIMEHPQLFKAGYSLQGGVRVVNPEDESEILVPLMKFKESEDLELPFRAALLVLRETNYVPMAETAVPKSRKGKNAVAYEEEEDDVPVPKKTSAKSKKKVNHMF